MSNVSQNGKNGKVALTTLRVGDLEQMARVLSLPDLSTSLMDRVQAGQVETGSEWDGWPLEKIYAACIAHGDRPETAAAMVDSIMTNRFYFARNPLGHRPALDQIEEAIAAEEPWYWGDM